MASENVIAMMIKKGAPFSVEQLRQMEDRDCWRWIYAHYPPKTKRPNPSTLAVCFTGFRPEEKDNLKKLAEQVGYRVLTGVSGHLNILVTGPAPGPSKIEKARQQGITILSEAEFLAKMDAVNE
jgi:BRCT domain type II-containing protein